MMNNEQRTPLPTILIVGSYSSFIIHTSSFLLLVSSPRKCFPPTIRKVPINPKATSSGNHQENKAQAGRSQQQFADAKQSHIHHQTTEQPVHQVIPAITDRSDFGRQRCNRFPAGHRWSYTS